MQRPQPISKADSFYKLWNAGTRRFWHSWIGWGTCDGDPRIDRMSNIESISFVSDDGAKHIIPIAELG